MKAKTLWQPYASLVAVGAKRFETRTKAPPRAALGQRFAIHAAKRDPFNVVRDLPTQVAMAMDHKLDPYNYSAPEQTLLDLPRGVILCTVRLVWAGRVGAKSGGPNVTTMLHDRTGPAPAFCPVDPYGDYSAGRWVWGLAEVRRLQNPVPWKGAQGWFTVPDEEELFQIGGEAE